MASRLPSQAFRRSQIQYPACKQQVRHASLLRRPHRPYTFTQLVTLSDGSTYTQRTTSPLPIYKTTKDTRNHPLWQPSLESLRNIEQDEAGRLKAFREKFGRGWDAEGTETVGDGIEEESLMDLISGGAQNYTAQVRRKAEEKKANAASGKVSASTKDPKGKK